MNVETIARRYASALADVAIASGNAEQTRTELAAWAATISGNADLANVFTSPAIAHAGKEKVLAELISRAKPSTSTANFLRVLLQNGRLGDIAEINDKFAQVLEERSGIISAQVISARELPQDTRAGFETTLGKMTGKKVNVTYTIDADLIGGVVTRIGSTVYDASVRSKLDNLKAQLAEV